ncbi:MAG: site-specific integrase [Actinomycetota bacterium]
MSRLPPGVRRRGTRFQARWRSQDGHERSATFDTPDDAVAHLVAVRRGDYSDSQRTVADWVARWRANAQGRPSTLARDDSYLRNHFLPHFGARPIADIRAWELQEWITGLAGRLAPASVHKVHSGSSKVFGAAVLAGDLQSNPAREVQLPAIPDTEAHFLTPVELAALDEAVATAFPSWAEAVPMLADAALRIGELGGLTVRDLDLGHGAVHVRQTLVEVRGTAHLGPPKSRHGRRVVPTLTANTCALLAARIDRLGLAADDPLFAGPQGGLLRPSLFRRRVFKPAVELAGLQGKVTPHTLRHTGISMWIAAGVVDAFKLARWAGHRDPTMIYRIYGHLIPEDTTEFRTRLAEVRHAADPSTLRSRGNERAASTEPRTSVSNSEPVRGSECE